MRRQFMWSLTMYSGVTSVGLAGGASACQLMPQLSEAGPALCEIASMDATPAPVAPTPAMPNNVRHVRAATPTILLLLPWRVKVDEDRLHRKLLRASDELLAGETRNVGRGARVPASPRIVIVRSSALMAYHQADALVKVSLDGITADENASQDDVTARLSYVLERRATDYGRMVPWAAGTVEASKSPFRQIGAVEAARGSDPDETAFSRSAASTARVRTTGHSFQYVRPMADVQAEVVEDAIVRIVRDFGELA
jgi:hypothetical protein